MNINIYINKLAIKIMKYFGYGSNLSDDQMDTCGGKYTYLGIGKLENYKLDFRRPSKTWRGGVADIVKSKGNSVYGAIYEIDNECLNGLDKKEGLGKAYRKLESIVVFEMEKIVCLIYEVIDKTDKTLPPSKSYIETIISGAKSKNFPNEYIQFLENFKH
jgi:gamma-glutamylcyclotransferase